MLKRLKVKDLMTKNVVTTLPDEEVVFAFEKLMKHKISSLPVLNNDGKMIGIVTATDLGHNLVLDKYKLGTLVKSVMITDIASVSISDNLFDVICTMYESAPDENIINQLPVIENGELKGIISDGDIIKAIKKDLS